MLGRSWAAVRIAARPGCRPRTGRTGRGRRRSAASRAAWTTCSRPCLRPMFPACRTTCSLVRPAEPGAGLRHGQVRRREEGPVRDVGDALGRDAQRDEVRGERLRDDPDRAGTARRPGLGRGGRPRDGAAAGHPGLARRPAHQVLEEEAVGGAEPLPGEPCQDAAGQAGDDPQDRVRARQAQAGEEPGEPERALVHRPPHRRLGRRDVVRRADDRDADGSSRSRRSARGVPRAIRQAG